MKAYEDLADALEGSGIKRSNMFGMPVLKLGRKPICGLWEDGVNFKLRPGSVIYERALSLEGSHIFQPVMKNGRVMTMKNWIIVPAMHHAFYMDLALESIKMVESEGL